jgi:hypothetical protein
MTEARMTRDRLMQDVKQIVTDTEELLKSVGTAGSEKVRHRRRLPRPAAEPQPLEPLPPLARERGLRLTCLNTGASAGGRIAAC